MCRRGWVVFGLLFVLAACDEDSPAQNNEPRQDMMLDQGPDLSDMRRDLPGDMVVDQRADMVHDMAQDLAPDIIEMSGEMSDMTADLEDMRVDLAEDMVVDMPPVVGQPRLPAPRGTCPSFANVDPVDGTDLMFTISGNRVRTARIWINPANTTPGPVVFNFQGSSSNPDPTRTEPMGSASRQRIVNDLGGMVVSLHPDPNRPRMVGNFLWYLVSTDTADDAELMDEVLACAAAGPGIDIQSIHAIGFSAGAIHSARVSLLRRNYLASIYLNSGGLHPGDYQGMALDFTGFAVLAFHGAQDVVSGYDFAQASARFAQYVNDNGGYALDCVHNNGHRPVSGRDNRLNNLQFLLDHRYGQPSPYANMPTPTQFFGTCSRPQTP